MVLFLRWWSRGEGGVTAGSEFIDGGGAIGGDGDVGLAGGGDGGDQIKVRVYVMNKMGLIFGYGEIRVNVQG